MSHARTLRGELDFRALAPWLLAALAALAGMWWQRAAGTQPDVYWLTLMAERMLDGDRPYVDTFENNPPASIYIYVPAVLLARLLHISSELAVQIFTLGLLGLCLAATYAMLTRAGYSKNYPAQWLFAACVALFVLMPAETFAQREYIAAVLALPYLGLVAIRTAGVSASKWMIVTAGLAIGAVVAIKPPLACVALFASGIAFLAQRSWRVLFVAENWIGAGVFLTYTAAIFYFHAAFLSDTLPLLKDVYLRDRLAVIVFIVPSFHAALFLLAHAWLMHRSDWLRAPEGILYAAAAGFLVSYFVQMKYFPYHIFPVCAFVMLAVSMSLLRKDPEQRDNGEVLSRKQKLFSFAVIAVIGIANFYLYQGRHFEGRLTQALRSSHPAPRVVGFTTYIGQHVRDVRNAGGTWVASFGQTYVPPIANSFRGYLSVDAQWEKRLQHWEQWTADVFLRDLKTKHPDIVLMTGNSDFNWPNWIARYPSLRTALAEYKFDRQVDFADGSFP
ncbi:MAG: hypothetical protein AB7J19_19575, partial [Beijerinckiaceae bacterium]